MGGGRDACRAPRARQPGAPCRRRPPARTGEQAPLAQLLPAPRRHPSTGTTTAAPLEGSTHPPRRTGSSGAAPRGRAGAAARRAPAGCPAPPGTRRAWRRRRRGSSPSPAMGGGRWEGGVRQEEAWVLCPWLRWPCTRRCLPQSGCSAAPPCAAAPPRSPASPTSCPAWPCRGRRTRCAGWGGQGASMEKRRPGSIIAAMPGAAHTLHEGGRAGRVGGGHEGRVDCGDCG